MQHSTAVISHLENPTYMILVKELHGHFETFMQTSLTSEKIFQSTLKIRIAARIKTRATLWNNFSKTP